MTIRPAFSRSRIKDDERQELKRDYPVYKELVCDGIEVIFISDEETECPWEPYYYVARGVDRYGKRLNMVKATYDHATKEVDLEYNADPPVKFQRIRRITGYLVGDLERFNDAKRSEESQRVKHNVGRRTMVREYKK